MTNLVGEWICSNMRPLSLIEDTGYVYGPIKLASILASRTTITQHLKLNASDGREQIKYVLLKAARTRCLILSPDIWSDACRQQSYLGCTAHWVDDKWLLHMFEIFCIPYHTANKKASNVLKINLNQALEDKQSPRLVQSTIIRWLSMSNCLKHYQNRYYQCL